MPAANDEGVVLVFDCGSISLKSVAVDAEGRIVAQASRPNGPRQQENGKPGWLVWDLEETWRKLCEGAQEVAKKVGRENIEAVTVTTWGADGAPVARDGRLTYPPISWQCPRTEKTAKKIVEKISAWEIFQITGYNLIPFNTLFKQIWLRENVPKALEGAHTWLMMPGLIAHKLTGMFHIEPTSASTMMAMDLKRRDWSTSMLELAGLDPSFFPEWSEPGEIVGYVTEEAGKQCGVPSGVAVVAGGHDTQFALFSSGAEMDEAILSSGTWEILGIRADTSNPTRSAFEDGMIIEADVQPGLWNPQLLMMGSGVLEWVLDKFFPQIGYDKYDIMTQEAESTPAGSEGVVFIPSFVRETGPTKKYGALGTVLGLTLRTSRGQILRSVLEGLSFQLKQALGILAEATGFQVKGIRVVGGGSKNPLWNQIRADVTSLPVTVTEKKEYTSLGAALVAFVGIGRYKSLKDAVEHVVSQPRVFDPGADQPIYETVFKRYIKALEGLRSFYIY